MKARKMHGRNAEPQMLLLCLAQRVWESDGIPAPKWPPFVTPRGKMSPQTKFAPCAFVLRALGFERVCARTCWPLFFEMQPTPPSASMNPAQAGRNGGHMEGGAREPSDTCGGAGDLFWGCRRRAWPWCSSQALSRHCASQFSRGTFSHFRTPRFSPFRESVLFKRRFRRHEGGVSRGVCGLAWRPSHHQSRSGYVPATAGVGW